jgi:hypothetical protein
MKPINPFTANLPKKAAKKTLTKAERDENLKKFLELSVIKDRMFHGSTNPGIVEFKTGKTLLEERYPQIKVKPFEHSQGRDAAFLTPDPQFASRYSGEEWAVAPGTAPTVYPVRVQAQNPWDFDNPEHIEAAINLYKEKFPLIRDSSGAVPSFDANRHRYLEEVLRELPSRNDNWSGIERPDIQEVIRDLGHDSFYVKERGVKNLGVYDPKKIKSDLGNQGTYDVTDPDITKAAGGLIRMQGGGDVTDKPLLADEAIDQMARYNSRDSGSPLSQFNEDLTILPEEDTWNLLKGLDRIYTPKIGEYIADVQSPAELLGRIKDLDPEYVDALTSGLSELVSQTQPSGPNSFDSVPKYHGSDPLDKLNRQEIDEAAWQVYENPALASTFVNVLQNPLAYTMTESAVDQPRDIKAEVWNEEFPKWKEDLLGAPADIQPFSQLTSNAAVTGANPLDYTPGLSDKGLGAGFADPGVVEMIDRFDRNQVAATPELAALDQSIASQESNALNQGLARLMSVDQITGDIDPVQSLRNLQAYDPASFEATLSTLQDVPSLVPQSGLGSLRLGMEQLQGLEGVTPTQVGETANAFASILKQPEIGSQVQDIAQNIRNITENQEPVQPVQEDEDLGGGYMSLTPLVRSNFFDKGQQEYRKGGLVRMSNGGDPTQMFNFNPMAAKAAKQKQMRESTPETPLGALSRGFATGLFGSTEEQVPYTGSIMEGSPQRQQSQANLREIGRNVGALTDIGGMVTPFVKPATQAVTRGATALGRAGLEQVDRAMFGEGPLGNALSMAAPLNVNAPVSRLGFYNPIEEMATTLQRKQGPGQAFLNEFTKAGISKQRLEDAGLAQKLAAAPNVTREEVQAMTKGTMPDVEEVVLSRSVIPPYMKGFADLHMPDLNVNDYRQIIQLRKLADERYQKALAENDLDAAEFAMKAEEDINKFSRTHSYGTKPGERLTEYHEYQEPGGKNYREVLLKVPSSEKYDENFRSTHWSDPNVISHIRMNDRVDADNKNVLFIEELQSDWAQEGRKKGFAGKPLTKDDLVATVNNSADRPYWEVRTKDGHFIANTGLGDKEINAQEAVDEALQLVQTRGDKRTPAGPFVKNTNEWVDLSLKNIIKRAVDEGYDRVAFIDGYKSFLRFPQDAKGESTEAGMRKFYDEIIPGRLKALVGKDNVRTIPGITQQRPLDLSLQGDRYYVVDADTDIAIPDHPGFRSLERAEQYLDELYSKSKSMDQIGFDITPEIREKFSQPIPYKHGGVVKMAAGGAKKLKRASEAIAKFQDPQATKIQEWQWRPLAEVNKQLNLAEVPDYIQRGYGDFMIEQGKRAAAGNLGVRDLIKAYGITQSSIGRGGLSYDTATKAGLKVPKTEGLVRPEGAFAEWLGSKQGQKFLDDAEKGVVNEKALDDIRAKFAPFGKANQLTEQLRYGVNSVSTLVPQMQQALIGSSDEYRDWAESIKGIAGAKSGFIGSMLGRGDLPTLDARQLNLHSLDSPVAPQTMMQRGKGLGAREAVDRLAARQSALGLDIDPSLDPYYQHLAHHAVWDKVADEKTTHEDLMRALRGYKEGGEPDTDAMRLEMMRKSWRSK